MPSSWDGQDELYNMIAPDLHKRRDQQIINQKGSEFENTGRNQTCISETSTYDFETHDRLRPLISRLLAKRTDSLVRFYIGPAPR
jgi:hypothetical protein